MIIFIIFISIVIFGLIYHLLTRKFLNPYKLIVIFGKKGSGKSTDIAKRVDLYRSKGIKCYCNSEVNYTYRFDMSDFGKYAFEPDSVVFIDEASIYWDNRNFKSFPKAAIEYLRLQRHFKNTIYIYSQTFDMDKKVRDLADELWLMQKFARVFTYSKRISKILDIKKAEFSADADSQVVENLTFTSFLIPGNRSLTFIPAWISSFDSFWVSDMQPVPAVPQFRFDRDLPDTARMRITIINKLRYAVRSFCRCKWQQLTSSKLYTRFANLFFQPDRCYGLASWFRLSWLKLKLCFFPRSTIYFKK